MNDSLTLDRSTRTRRHRSKPASLPCFAVETLGGTIPRSPKVVPLRDRQLSDARAADPSIAVLERLGLGAPALLAGANQSTRFRLAELVIKRLGAMIRNATSTFCLDVGEVASTISAPDAVALQDAALTLKPRMDDLLAEAARALSPAQLLALLAAASHDHDPTGIDALRCRHVVTAGTDALAREAMLDLASGAEAASSIVDRVVALHMVRLFRSSGLLSADLLDALDDRGRTDHADRSTVRRASGGASQNPLLRALARGEHETAVTLLAAAAGVSVETVRAAIFLRTSKGLLSLGWRAGLDAADAAGLQDSLGRLPPSETLRPTEDGAFPLTGPEMLWQCRFLSRAQHAFDR